MTYDDDGYLTDEDRQYEKEQQALEEEQRNFWKEALTTAHLHAVQMSSRGDRFGGNIDKTYWAHFWEYLRDNFTVQPK